VKPLKCSPELEIPGPVDAQLLVVPRRRKPQLDERTGHRHLDWQEVRLTEFFAIRGDRVDLTELIRAVDETLRTTPAAAGGDEHNVASPNCPLALDAQELRPEVEKQVVSFVAERLEHADP
jgi:hypothetical protein